VPAESELHIDDEKVLASVPTRAERRQAGGIVRLSSGSVDIREPDWDALWTRDSGAQDEDDNEAADSLQAGSDHDQDQDDDDDEEDGDEDEDEEALPPPPPPAKRKRKADSSVTPAPAPKKVAFSKVPVGPSTQTASMTKTAPKSALKPKAKPRTSVAEARRKLAAAVISPTKGKAATTKAKVLQAQEDGAYVFGEFF
jgi:hypothetical protein